MYFWRLAFFLSVRGIDMRHHKIISQGAFRCLIMLWAISTSLLSSCQVQAIESVQLSADVGLPRVSVPLASLEQQSLQVRRIIRLGVTTSGYEPLEVVRDQSVRGIAADYLSIIGTSLGLKVEVQVFPDWATALAALHGKEVDVLARGSSFEEQLPGLLLSRPYTENQPVLVGRGGDLGEDALLQGGRLAVVDGYASLNELAARYPKVKLEVYPTVREALHAVEYQNVNWLVCDAATVAYHLALGELPSLRMRPQSNWRPVGYGFVFRVDDALLRDLFDRVLESIPRVTQAEIFGHWGVSARFDSERTSAYTPEQLIWLATRPQVKVVVSGGTPPYSFYDDEGEFRGFLADFLAEVSLRSGMRFQFVEFNSLQDVLEGLRDGHGEMTTMLLPTSERKVFLNFTDPFVKSSFALVGPRNSSIKTLADLQDRRVAMVKNSSVIQYVHEFYPTIKPVLTDSYLETLMAVAGGRAEAAVLLLPVSRYMINQYFARDLRVITSLTQIQESLSFAVTKDNPMLYEVMQASLNQLEPRVVGTLVERWQNSLPAESSVWGSYERKLRWFFLAGAVVLVLLVLWQGYAYFNRVRDRAEKARQAFRSELLDGIPQSVVVRDLQGNFVLCNHTFFRKFQLKPEDVIGRSWVEVDGLDLAQEGAQQRAYQALLERNEAIDVQLVELRICNENFTFRQWAVPHRGSDGQVVGLLMGWIDVSDTQRLLQQLQEASDQAVQASAAKSRFLAVMSHEIRTPLNAIIGLLELTIERFKRGESWDRSAIEVAYSSASALMLLIGDILDLAKIESGKLTLEPGRNNPREILDSVQRVFYGLARQKGLYLESELQLDSDQDVLVDGCRLKQVLSNLLGNAIKFTDSGGIKLSLRAQELGSDLRMVFVVRDSGIGISSLGQASLFEPFSQVREASSLRGGTGLGLAICQQLIEMMGGQLYLQSEFGVGTQVTVELQVPILEGRPSDQVRSSLIPADSATLSVLLVDDHLPNRLLLRQQLSFLGHRVKEAENGQQAFTCLQVDSFDVVITDCNMPIMDGYELTRRIRAGQHDKTIAPCLIIGFTANAQAEERVRCLNAGMDDCMFKPVGLNLLRTCLAKVVRNDSHSGAPVPIPDESMSGESRGGFFDLDLLMSLTDGDRQVIRVLFSELLATNEVDKRRLEELMAVGQWHELGQIVHRLKGAARMVGAHQLVEATSAYEAGLGQAVPDDEARRRAVAVHDAVTHLQEAVVGWMEAVD